MFRPLNLGTAGPGDSVSAAAAAEPAKPSGAALPIAYGIALAGLAAGVAISVVYKPTAFKPLDGFSALALFYIAAQAIERAIEPFTGLVKAPADGGSKTKEEAQHKVRSAVAAWYVAAGTAKAAAAQDAAKWQRVVEAISKNTALYAWAASVVLGALASALFGLFLMRAVGASAVPVALDIVVTALVISGGSKALHDLIQNIQKSKEKKETPPETS